MEHHSCGVSSTIPSWWIVARLFNGACKALRDQFEVTIPKVVLSLVLLFLSMAHMDPVRHAGSTRMYKMRFAGPPQDIPIGICVTSVVLQR